MRMSRKEEPTPESTSMQRVSWKSRFSALRATMLAPIESRKIQPAPWTVRFFAGFYLMVYLWSAAWGWHEFQRGFTVSCYVGAAFMLVAAFFLPQSLIMLIRGRVPDSWRKRKAD
jgi:hypothetical protein